MNKIISIFAISLVIILSIGLISAETLTRSGPSTVTSGELFQITYTLSGVTGNWFSILEDTATGGCTMPDGTSSYKSAWVSDEGSTTKIINVQAPSSGSCTLTGTYGFTDGTVQKVGVALNTYTVTVSGTCTPSCTGKACGNDGCGGSCGTCTSGKTCEANQCVTTTCTPDCSGKACGLDSVCGVSCGTCQTGFTCSSNTCISSGTNQTTGFDINKCVVPITDTFCLTWLYIIIGVIALIFLFAMFRKK